MCCVCFLTNAAEFWKASIRNLCLFSHLLCCLVKNWVKISWHVKNPNGDCRRTEEGTHLLEGLHYAHALTLSKSLIVSPHTFFWSECDELLKTLSNNPLRSFAYPPIFTGKYFSKIIISASRHVVNFMAFLFSTHTLLGRAS